MVIVTFRKLTQTLSSPCLTLWTTLGLAHLGTDKAAVTQISVVAHVRKSKTSTRHL